MNENLWAARWPREQIKALLLEQFEAFMLRDPGIARTQLVEVLRAASLPHAVIVSGLRRVGKSTLLAQVARHLGEDRFYYLNFEDERFLGFEVADANTLYGMLVELFGEREILIVDEIQNIPGWERFVRRFMDMGLKFYITGSNASLLSRELGTHLTGRHVPIELFPFSFAEFLRFRGRDLPDLARLTTRDKAQVDAWLAEYLRLGGIPEPLTYPDLPLARALYDDVLYRDIATRHRIPDPRALRELAFSLMSNPASLVSYNKIKGHLGLGSVNTVKSYIQHLEDSWLILTTSVHDFSVKRQQVAPKKVYAIDTGLAQAVGFSFSPNTGRLLENLVFLALRRRDRDLYHYATASGYEVDFYRPRTRELIQVTQGLEHAPTRESELRALTAAMRELGLSRGTILTDAPAATLRDGDLSIDILPISEWLLQVETASAG